MVEGGRVLRNGWEYADASWYSPKARPLPPLPARQLPSTPFFLFLLTNIIQSRSIPMFGIPHSVMPRMGYKMPHQHHQRDKYYLSILISNPYHYWINPRTYCYFFSTVEIICQIYRIFNSCSFRLKIQQNALTLATKLIILMIMKG